MRSTFCAEAPMRTERLAFGLRAFALLGAASAMVWACGTNKGFGPDSGGDTDGSSDAVFNSDCSFCGVETTTKETGPTADPCHVPPDNSGDNAPTCTAPPAPPNSFAPVSKWTWSEPTTIQSQETT